MPQPDASQIAKHLHAAADQIHLLKNLPAVSDASTLQEILNGIERLQTDIARLESKIAIMDHNTQARLYNSFLTSCQQPLDAIKTLADAVPIGFPTNKARLATMSGLINSAHSLAHTTYRRTEQQTSNAEG